MSTASVALGVAIGEMDQEVREEWGENRGARISEYRENCEPPIGDAVPWCALFVQYVTDVACRALRIRNPLDGVRLEAYVQSYYDWAAAEGRIIPPEEVLPGDLALFNFRNVRWDHIGLVLSTPTDSGTFQTIEGNTNEAGAREGDGVFEKDRTTARYPVVFVRWAA